MADNMEDNSSDAELDYPVHTLTGRKNRHGKQARYWEFVQYEPKRFKKSLLVHRQLGFYIYQRQTINTMDRDEPYNVVHGLLRFNRPVSYGGVLIMIGGGEHCMIQVAAKDPASVVQSCCDPMFKKSTTVGTFKKSQKARVRKTIVKPSVNLELLSSHDLRKLIRKRKIV